MAHTFKLATWNINSVRLRKGLVETYLKSHQPDILCLQEIKCQEAEFPSSTFAKLGYEYIAVNGQKGYHGVATISKLPLTSIEKRNLCGMGDARHIECSAQIGKRKVKVHNFYVPAGGDEPDRTINPKFGHKLDFLEEMRAINANTAGADSAILVGDLNIAPLESDVWSHKQLLNVVSHTPIETQTLEDLRVNAGWVDLMRHHYGLQEEIFTWWSYRSKDWKVNNRGRRLDHIWGSSDLSAHITDIDVLTHARDWEKPSDHVPVMASFRL